MKRKPKPKAKSRRVSRKPAPLVALAPQPANLPAVIQPRQMVSAEDGDVQKLVSCNFYKLATGGEKVPLPILALIDRVEPRTLMRWLPRCATPPDLIHYRPGPGARCQGWKGGCKSCPEDGGRPGFRKCGAKLAYVAGHSVKLFLNTLFPGRWSLEGVTVNRFTEGATDDYHVTGTLVVRHNDGREQRIFQAGTCAIRKNSQSGDPQNPGFYLKGAITDLIKKAASELGICYDVYSGMGFHEDIPASPQAQRADAEGVRNALAALVAQIEERCRKHPKSVHKPNGYTPRMLWDEAVNMWGDAFADDHQPFGSIAEGLDVYTALPVDQRRALYAKMRNKWLRSENALRDASYSETESKGTRRPAGQSKAAPKSALADPPDDTGDVPGPFDGDPAAGDDEGAGEHTAAPEVPRRPHPPAMDAKTVALFKTKACRILGGCTWAVAEGCVNRAVELRRGRGKLAAEVVDWTDLDSVNAQYTISTLQEEVARGTFKDALSGKAGR